MATELTASITELPDGTAAWVAGRRSRGGGGTDEGTFALDGEAAGRGLFRGASVVLAVPSVQMVMRVLEFPAADADELGAMVGLQVDKFSPFPLDQMVVSHEVLVQRDSGCTVLAVAARGSVISAAGLRFKDAGIKISRVDALLLGRWQTLVDSGLLEREGRETLVLMDGGCVDVLTQEARIPVALSGLGSVPMPGDTETANELALEIEHLLMGLEAERGRVSPSMVTVWSQKGEGRTLAGALQARLKQTVRERSLDSLASALRGTARRAQIAPAVGALLDLTPAAWRETERLQWFRRRMIIAAAALLGGWVLLAACGWGAVALQRAQVERLKVEEQRAMEPANAVRRLRMQVQMIRRYMDRRTSALECLREISLLQPTGVDLSSFTYRKGDGMELVGEADSGALVIEYNEKLNASALFQSVKAGPRTLTPKQRHRFSFELTFAKEAP